jgi:Arc/MetJ family transcription regulator
MSRTNVELNETLVNRGLKATGLRTKRALIDHALKELLRHETQRGLLKLRGKIHWEGDLAEMRRGREFR